MENKIHIQRDKMRAMNSFRQRECTFFLSDVLAELPYQYPGSMTKFHAKLN